MNKIESASRACLIAFILLINSLTVHAMEPSLNQRIDQLVDQGRLEGLHAALIVQDGRTRAERYYAGQDWKWGESLGERRFDRDALHDVRSITKSIVAMLYGIALHQGLVPDPTEPLYAQFPDYPIDGSDRKKSITIHHALTMTTGLAWDESAPYTSLKNSEIAMEAAADRIAFILNQPLAEAPGKRWNYSGGSTVLVARIIENETGMPLDAFADQHLFKPLGLKRWEWISGSDGKPASASGLRLSVDALAKIGRLLLNQGQWQGEQIIPEIWMKRMLARYTSTNFDLGYGYFWYTENQDQPSRFSAIGNGGQRLYINIPINTVIIVLTGNYNKPDAWRLPVKVILDVFLPSLDQ